jgi:apolipoprotein N-acyltransferase
MSVATTAGGPMAHAPAGTHIPVATGTAVSDIIDRARQAPAPRRGTLLMAVVSAVLFFCACFPLDWGWLGWIAPVPLLLLTRLKTPTRWMLRSVYVGGACYWVVTLSWMRLGDPTMIPAWLALAFYLAGYWPLFVGLCRRAVQRLNVPLMVAAPVVWVGLEYLRSHLLTGFGWYLLGHTQWRNVPLIQIADLVGAYGISGVMMLSAAAIAELVPEAWFARLKLLPPLTSESVLIESRSRRVQTGGVLVSVVVVAAAIGYGAARLNHAEFASGPRVTLVQGDFRSQIKHDPERADQIYLKHEDIGGATVQKYRPELIIWPETMFPYSLLLADDSLTEVQLKQMFPFTDPKLWRMPQRDVRPVLRSEAEKHGAAMLVGIVTQVALPQRAARYNSAAFVEPQRGVTGRYDKIHRVPFGEYIPCRDMLPFLGEVSAYGSSTDLTAGSDVTVFTLGEYRLLPMICFEDTVPHLVRDMLRRGESAAGEGAPDEPVDILVNLTNDGWFRNSSEQEQHLVTSLFRAIETRRPLVRAVNTGISAVIDGDGRIREPVTLLDFGPEESPLDAPAKLPGMIDPETGGFYKSRHAALVADVPLDGRGSWYMAGGDWFAAGCLVLTLASLGWTAFRRGKPAAS